MKPVTMYSFEMLTIINNQINTIRNRSTDHEFLVILGSLLVVRDRIIEVFKEREGSINDEQSCI